MTGITLIGTGNMCRRLACRCDAIVTTLAGTEDFIVIHIDHGSERVGVMTGFTQFAGEQVAGRFTNGCDIVMTRHTSLAGNGTVIKCACRDQPCIGIVAGIARLNRGDMAGTFATCQHTIVTALAGP